MIDDDRENDEYRQEAINERKYQGGELVNYRHRSSDLQRNISHW